MATNVTSVWRLIRSVDPLLRLSDAGRGITLTSSLAHNSRAFWSPYAASKAAVEALTRSWAEETQNLPLRVNSFDPGRTRTAMRAQAMPGEDPETVPHPSEVAKKVLLLADPSLQETGGIYQRTHVFSTASIERLVSVLGGHYVLFVEKPSLERGEHRIDVRLKGRSGTVYARTAFED